MRNKLQYAYSILVFVGVLFTSYLMMDKDGNAKVPLRVIQGPGLRTEAVSLDPAVNQLFEMEEAISLLRKDKLEIQKRFPTDLTTKKKERDE